MLAFGIARRFGYDAVRRWSWAARLLDRTRSQAALAGIVFASRLVPFISFDAVSYAAGLTPLRWWWFARATLAGVVPVSVALVWFDERMDNDGPQNNRIGRGKTVFPAGAGMNRTPSYSGSASGRVPRRRGDEPRTAFHAMAQAVCSPQARG